ncbi:MAG: transposase [Candidatus Hydrogenedentota bacterium]|nr:MAG: transposase [Candidatus Hydrogenedentota bacterium]
MNRSQIANKLKGQIEEFSGKLSKGLPRVVERFMEEMLYGILCRQSVHVTEIARALNERIRLIKTVNRLCRQLGRHELEEGVTANLIEEGATHIKRDTLLLIDPSDLSKKYAKKMEYLARVRDGSEKKLSRGYWTVRVVGAELQRVKIIPLYEHLYSQRAPDFESENREILKAVDCVRRRVGHRGIWVMDRGGDRRKLFAPFLERGMRFIIRLEGHRHLEYRGRNVPGTDLAASCPTPYAERIIREESSGERVYNIQVGFRRVKLPGREQRLALVVVKQLGGQPLMILTNVEVVKSRRSVMFVVLSYFRRWQIEETIRFAKQAYQIEDIRLRRYHRLQNMIVIVWAVVHFVAVWLGEGLKLGILAHHALQAAKRVLGIAAFRYYALADGIKASLAGCEAPLHHGNARPRADPQLMLPL